MHRRSARAGHAVPDGRVSAPRRRVTHEGTPDARAVRRVWSDPAPLYSDERTELYGAHYGSRSSFAGGVGW